MKLLIIDDDALLADFFKLKFAKLLPALEIQTAVGIRDADQVLNNFNPDTIILDLHLQPDEPSALILQKTEDYAKIAPLVVITGGFYGPQERIKMIKLGVKAFLDKNMITENVFFDRIIEILKSSQS